VAVDVPALADQGRELDYLVPSDPEGLLEVGAMVRVPLHGRRVLGWVVAIDVSPPAGIALQPIIKISSRGPSADVVELTAWGAWRWAGRRTALLRAASPLGVVRRLPARPARSAPAVATVGAGADPESLELAREARAAGEAVVRLPPASTPLPFLLGVLAGGPALIITPAVDGAQALTRALNRSGGAAVTVPEGWARAAAGGASVVGARAAAWAPAPDMTAIVVLDAHDDGLVEQRAPSWSAWEVAAQRARRHEIPCLLVSPCPRVTQLRWGRLLTPSRATERRGWAPVEIIDRRDDDPRKGLLGERLVPILRGATMDRRVVCVLNRKGRVRLLACRACQQLAVCEHCGGVAEGASMLVCRRCGRSRPAVCHACGSTALRALRLGVSKLREDLEVLTRSPVGEVTAEVAELPPTPVLIGTEAVLHRLSSRGEQVGAVVFIEFDSELSAPRYRAGEDALVLLARAARLVGGRGAGGRVVVQTYQPDHVVLQAAVLADPGRLAEVELALRTELHLPPASALAELSGHPEVTDAVAADLAALAGIEALGPTDGRWLIRAPDHQILCDALATVGRPAGADGVSLRVDVDPVRA